MTAAWHKDKTYTCEESVTIYKKEWVEHTYKRWVPGVGYGYDLSEEVMAGIGVFKNSQGNVVPLGMIDWRPLKYENVSAGLFAGATMGYCVNSNAPIPTGGISVRIDVGDVAIHSFITPKIKNNTTTIGIAFSWKI
jgi:hypothetical protein